MIIKPNKTNQKKEKKNSYVNQGTRVWPWRPLLRLRFRPSMVLSMAAVYSRPRLGGHVQPLIFGFGIALAQMTNQLLEISKARPIGGGTELPICRHMSKQITKTLILFQNNRQHVLSRSLLCSALEDSMAYYSIFTLVKDLDQYFVLPKHH